MLNRVLLSFVSLGLLAFSASAATPPIKNYKLQKQDGQTFQLNDLKGNYVFVSFIYTRCPMPTMCPLTMTLNKQVFNLWKKSASKSPLKFLIVTLDPSHDTPSRLKEYAKTHGVTDPAFIFATGTEQEISDFSSEFNAIGFPSNGLISHNSKSVLLNPDLSPLKDYKDNEWKPEDVWKDLKAQSDKKGENPS